LGKNRLQLGLYTRYPHDLCVQQGIFRVGLLNDAYTHCCRPLTLALARLSCIHISRLYMAVYDLWQKCMTRVAYVSSKPKR